MSNLQENTTELHHYIKTKMLRVDGNPNVNYLRSKTHLNSKFPKIIEELTTCVDSSIGVKIKLEFILNGCILPKCEYCGKIVNKAFRKNFNRFCSRNCSANSCIDKSIKTKKTNLEERISNLKPENETPIDMEKLIQVLNNKPRNLNIENYLLDNKIYFQVLSFRKYEDDSLPEIIHRIKNKLDDRPKCWCGEHIKYPKAKNKGYFIACNVSHSQILIFSKYDVNKAREYSITDFKKYSGFVRRITEKQPLHLLENIEKRGKAMNDGYHLDHIYPVKQGFMEGILPYVIGDIRNLQMLKAKDNLTKGAKIVDELYL